MTHSRSSIFAAIADAPLRSLWGWPLCPVRAAQKPVNQVYVEPQGVVRDLELTGQHAPILARVGALE